MNTYAYFFSALILAGSLISLGGSAAGLAAPPPSYSAKEIRATVVDEETGRSLEGVVVVAVWQLEPSGLWIRLQVSEAVTDAQGQFFIPGWGPKPRHPWGVLRTRSPLLIVFKHGYTPLELFNDSRKEIERLYPNYRTMPTKQLRSLLQPIRGTPDEALQESIWDGLTIQMEPFNDTPDRWLDLLDSAVSRVLTGSPSPEKDARHTRRFLEAIRAERKYFEINPIPPSKQYKLVSLFGRTEQLLKEAEK